MKTEGAVFRGIIYKAINKTSNKIYVGQTTRTLQSRKYHHKAEANMKNSDCYFHRALRKYGLDGFDWEIVCDIGAATIDLVRKYLNITEQMYIKYYDSFNFKNGFNNTEGGNGSFGLRGSKSPHYGKHPSPETREKISKALKGRVSPLKGKAVSAEFCKKLSESHKGQIPWNKNLTSETDERIRLNGIKIGRVLTGRKLSEEHKENISKGSIGRIFSEESKGKISKALKGNKHMLRKTHSEETRQKMKNAWKKRRLKMKLLKRVD